jgi:hypothetical protein
MYLFRKAEFIPLRNGMNSVLLIAQTARRTFRRAEFIPLRNGMNSVLLTVQPDRTPPVTT